MFWRLLRNSLTMHYHFIEIGTANFDTFIQKANDKVIGLSIEPLKHLLNQLPEKKNVTKINCAISDEEREMTIYYVTQESIDKYEFPWWFIGSSSVNKINDNIERVLLERGIDPSLVVESQIVKTQKLDKIIAEYNISSLSILKIDTEGHDAIILSKFFEDYLSEKIKFLPQQIIFEHNGLYDEKDYERLISTAEKLKYKKQEGVADTLLTLIV